MSWRDSRSYTPCTIVRTGRVRTNRFASPVVSMLGHILHPRRALAPSHVARSRQWRQPSHGNFHLDLYRTLSPPPQGLAYPTPPLDYLPASVRKTGLYPPFSHTQHVQPSATVQLSTRRCQSRRGARRPIPHYTPHTKLRHAGEESGEHQTTSFIIGPSSLGRLGTLTVSFPFDEPPKFRPLRTAL